LYALLSASQVMSCIISTCLCAVVAWWVTWIPQLSSLTFT
jgi:hypothetical protein